MFTDANEIFYYCFWNMLPDKINLYKPKYIYTFNYDQNGLFGLNEEFNLDHYLVILTAKF